MLGEVKNELIKLTKDFDSCKMKIKDNIVEVKRIMDIVKNKNVNEDESKGKKKKKEEKKKKGIGKEGGKRRESEGNERRTRWCLLLSPVVASTDRSLSLKGRACTPTRAEFYNEGNGAGKQIEIVFASFDKEEDQYKEYCGIMPWKAIPFGDPKIEQLGTKFDVSAIPRLIIMKLDGKVVNPNAKNDVMNNGPDALEDWLKL